MESQAVDAVSLGRRAVSIHVAGWVYFERRLVVLLTNMFRTALDETLHQAQAAPEPAKRVEAG